MIGLELEWKIKLFTKYAREGVALWTREKEKS